MGPVFLHVGTAFVEPTDGHTYDPTDGATTDPYPAVPACPWVATDDPSVLACAMAAVLKRAKAVASTIVVSFMVVSFLVVWISDNRTVCWIAPLKSCLGAMEAAKLMGSFPSQCP